MIGQGVVGCRVVGCKNGVVMHRVVGWIGWWGCYKC